MPHPTQHALVYDVGGSHISAAICAQHSYALYGVTRAPLPPESNSFTATQDPAFKFVRLIHALAARAAETSRIPLTRIVGASLAMPGPFDYEHGISQMRHKLSNLFGIDLKTALATRFHWQPSQLRFVNDAGAFLLGEVGAGAAKGFSRSVGITLGTGIGCAFALGDRIAVPSDQPGGEPGVPPGGEIWNLPYNGATVEDFVSTRYLRSQFLTLSGLEAEVSQVAAIAQCHDEEPCHALEETRAKQPSSVGSSASGAPKAASAHAQVAVMRAESKAARQSFHDFGRHLGLALNQHAAAFRPEVVVVGGGIARASHLFLPATREALTFPAHITLSTLMDQAPLAGAGVHWFTTGV